MDNTTGNLSLPQVFACSPPTIRKKNQQQTNHRQLTICTLIIKFAVPSYCRICLCQLSLLLVKCQGPTLRKNSRNQQQGSWYKFKFILIYFHLYSRTVTATGTDSADEGFSLPTRNKVQHPGLKEHTQNNRLSLLMQQVLPSAEI